MKWDQLSNLPTPMYDARATVQDKKFMSLVVLVLVMMLRMQYSCMTLIPIIGICYPPWATTKAFLRLLAKKLAIVGGRLSATKQRTNKVSTFNVGTKSWESYYPDLLSVRCRPGVITHLKHVIVAGGGSDTMIHDDIEILDWIENRQWQRVIVSLPTPMWGFTPTVSDNHFVIVGYRWTNSQYCLQNIC